MKESTREFVSGRFTVKLSLSRRPLRTSKPDAADVEREDVGDVEGDEEGEMAVLILVVILRRRGILVVCRCRLEQILGIDRSLDCVYSKMRRKVCEIAQR
jgi:hypothetical protein